MSVSNRGSVRVALPHPHTQTGIRVAAGNNAATVKKAVGDFGEESNVGVDVRKTCVETTKTAPVLVANADNKNPKGEEEAIPKVGGDVVGGLHAGGPAEGRSELSAGPDFSSK